MQTSNRLFDDLAKMANGAVSTVAGIKGEVEAMVRQQLERILVDMDMVPREEFEAMRAVAIKAREEQEKLEARVAALEAQLGVKAESKPRRAARPRKKSAD
ncbi:MAG: accessory factor UbiK family protein [Hyphomicrobiales bacterium]|nr:accessory factor UbiK family protein [Hyphomicrobiales bacterium]MCP5372331.1 accessory factor UbiK family protein [Hyphomicrobiales bacterium]